MSQTASDSTLSTYTASDGDNLAVQDWPLPDGVALRGVVVLVHGLGEHAWRYDHVARRLNDWGFAVRGYDQYGHGESGGVRGALPTRTRLVDDLADLIDSTRLRMEGDTPLIVLGHSMGGLVAGTLVAMRERLVDGLVLSSPALQAWLSPVQKMLLKVVPRVAPNFTVGNGLNPDFLSHDPAVVAAYKADPRVHDRISGRLGAFVAGGGQAVIDRAPHWKVPTLLMFAGADQLVNPAGSRAFAAAAPKDLVTVRCFDEHFHEIFNELDAEEVFEMLRGWLDEKFPAA
ncbi:MAG: lysophospholipase [Burkholderiales bacterium]|nr:lysophospholipase [Burkholderiales bacterium]